MKQTQLVYIMRLKIEESQMKSLNLSTSIHTRTRRTKRYNNSHFEMEMMNVLCDDSLCNILSYLDFKSAILFTKCTNKNIQNRIFSKSNLSQSQTATATTLAAVDDDTNNNNNNNNNNISCFKSLWKEIYLRHHFAPLTIEQSTNSNIIYNPEEFYVNLTKYKRTLIKNLMRKQTKESLQKKTNNSNSNSSNNINSNNINNNNKNSYCFTSLPNHHFHFLPITPMSEDELVENNNNNNIINNNHNNNDVPPVEFTCMSYRLTSPSTGSEYAFIDPFTGSITVYDNIMEHTIQSDVNLTLEKELISAIQSNCSKKEKDNHDTIISTCMKNTQNYLKDNPTTYTTISNSSNSSSGSISHEDEHAKSSTGSGTTTTTTTTTTNKEVLCSVQEYFYLDFQEYFGDTIQRTLGRTVTIDDDGIIIDWLGVDSHIMIDPNSRDVIGTMICAARMLFLDQEEDICVTEILAWKKQLQKRQESYKDGKMVCRVDFSPYFIDICPVYNRVYTSFSPDVDGNDTDVDTLDGHDSVAYHDRKIVIYPLLKYDSEIDSVEHGRRYFPPAQECIICDNAVTCFIVDPTGDNLVVGTDHGTIEIWDMTKTSFWQGEGEYASRSECINISMELNNLERTPSVEAQAQAATAHVERVSSSLYLYPTEDIITDGDISRSTSYDSRNNEHIEEVYERDLQLIDRDDIESSSEFDNASIFKVDSVNSFLATNTLHNIDDEIIMIEDDEHDQTMNEFIDEQVHEHSCHNEDSVREENECDEYRSSLSLPQCKPNREINSIEIPQHLSIREVGFVAMQHHRKEGTTLSLWQYCTRKDKFQLASLINLPLSPQRKPQVSYDGKRLILFGQDHIGLIILVYKVMR